MEMTNSGTPKRPVPEFAKEDQSPAIGGLPIPMRLLEVVA
jgi:hypothetical protein